MRGYVYAIDMCLMFVVCVCVGGGGGGGGEDICSTTEGCEIKPHQCLVF